MNDITITPRRDVSWPIVVPGSARVSGWQHRQTADRMPASGTVVVCGASGYGKTQLVAGLFADHTADLRLWVPATSPAGILARYARAATLLDLADNSELEEHRAALFLSWLNGTDRTWIVVLDNLNHPTALDPTYGNPAGLWPPIRPTGLTVATSTSRDPALTDGGGRSRIDLDVYTLTEAAAYITDRLGPAADRAELPPGALHNAEPLINALGRHPLALAQAAALILLDRLTTTEYHGLLTEHTLDKAYPNAQKRTVTPPLCKPPTTLLSPEPKALTAGLAQPLLLYLATLDPTGAPGILTSTPPALPKYLASHATGVETDPDQLRKSFGLLRRLRRRRGLGRGRRNQLEPEQVRDALGVLHRLSLITHTPGEPAQALRTHPLTARLTRENAAPSQQAAALRATADALLQVWPEVENDTDLAAALRANAITVLDYDTEHVLWGRRNRSVHPLWFRLGRSLGQAGLVQPAMTHFARLQVLAEGILGCEHRDTFAARDNLAHWLGEAGDPTSAVPVYSTLLNDMITLLGPDHPDTLTVRANLANWLGRAGDVAGATTAFEELLADRIRVLGPDHPDTVDTSHNLATSRLRAGEVSGVGNALEELLAERLRLLGPYHPDTLTIRNNLANWRGQAGDPAGAAIALESLIKEQVRVLGHNHPDVLTARASLAHWRGEAGDPAYAATTLAELLDDRLRVLGPDHPDVFTTRNSLAGWRGQAGDPQGAAEVIAVLLPDQLRTLGPDHPDTLATRANLADLRGKVGDASGAATAFADLLTDQLRVLGPGHPHTLATRQLLAYWQDETQAHHDGGS